MRRQATRDGDRDVLLSPRTPGGIPGHVVRPNALEREARIWRWRALALPTLPMGVGSGSFAWHPSVLELWRGVTCLLLPLIRRLVTCFNDLLAKLAGPAMPAWSARKASEARAARQAMSDRPADTACK